jgi:hypothetical protein
MRALFCVLLVGSVCAEETFTTTEWERERLQRRPYADLRLAYEILPLHGHLTTDTTQPAVIGGSGTTQDVVGMRGTRAARRFSLSIRESSGEDHGGGVGVFGFSLGYQGTRVTAETPSLRVDSDMRTILADVDLAYAFRPTSWTPLQLEIGGFAGVGGTHAERHVQSIYTDPVSGTVSTTEVTPRVWGFAYEVGLRCGFVWQILDNIQLGADARYMYFQTAVEGNYRDNGAGNTNFKDTLTLRGVGGAAFLGWRF